MTVLKWAIVGVVLILDLLAVLVLVMALNDPEAPAVAVWASLWIALVAGVVWIALVLNLTGGLRGAHAVQVSAVMLVAATGFVGYYAVKDPSAPAPRSAADVGEATDAPAAAEVFDPGREVRRRIAAADAKQRRLRARTTLGADTARLIGREAQAIEAALPIRVDQSMRITAVRFADGVMALAYTVDLQLSAHERNAMAEAIAASAAASARDGGIVCGALASYLRKGLIVRYDYRTKGGQPIAAVVHGPDTCGGRA